MVDEKAAIAALGATGPTAPIFLNLKICERERALTKVLCRLAGSIENSHFGNSTMRSLE